MLTIDGERTSEGLAGRVPPQLWFVGSAVFHYLGPSFAVLLFARVPVGGVAWLRIVSAAVLFAAWRRPWRSFFRAERATQRLTIYLGLVFAVMNYTFYMAISRLPLGTVAAIEFVGPIVLALAGSRTRRNLLALALAVAGVYLLTEVRVAGDPAAFGWAFANAGLFAVYIVLAHAVARADPAISPLDRLAAAMMIAGVAITPLGIIEATTVLTDPVAWAAGIGVGISSSIIPYVFDQMAMQRLSRATYSLFVALLPARPMTAEQLAAAVRVAYDPAAQAILDESPGNAPGWSSAGPVAAQEAWDHYRHDSGVSITWGMSEAPRGEVLSGVLTGLVSPHHDIARKRVTLLYRPHDPGTAARLVERDRKDARFRLSGPTTAARDAVAVAAADQSAREEAKGAGVVRFAMLVTATVRDFENLKAAAAAIDTLAPPARVQLRRMYGSQASAFAAALPLGIVLPAHLQVPAVIRGAL